MPETTYDACSTCERTTGGATCPATVAAECGATNGGHYQPRRRPIPSGAPANDGAQLEPDWRPPEWLSTLTATLRQILHDGGARHSFPGLVDAVERLIAKTGETQRRLSDLTATHLRTMDRLYEVERQRDELDIRRARLCERQGQGQHTAAAPEFTCPAEVAETMRRAARACEVWARGGDLGRTR